MRVGRIVGDVPYCSVGGMAHVASKVRPPCARMLAPRPKVGRGRDCVRGQGSVEIAIEARLRRCVDSA